MFDALPETFDKDVALSAAFAIHADFVVFEQLREFVTGKLAALVGIEDFRRSVSSDGLPMAFRTASKQKSVVIVFERR